MTRHEMKEKKKQKIKARKCKGCDKHTKQRWHNECYTKWVSTLLSRFRQ